MARGKPGQLTPLQRAFVQEYIIDLHATNAAIRAGYSPNSAQEISSRVMARPHVAAAIQAAMDERAKRTGIDADWVLKRLALIADASPIQIAKWDAAGVEFTDSADLTPEQVYLITEISMDETIKEDASGKELILKRHKKLKMIGDAAKTKALELIAKHIGMFDGQQTQAGPAPGFIVSGPDDA